MKNILKISIIGLFSVFMLTSCKNKVVKPTSYEKKLVLAWQVKIAKENGALVYTRGLTTNTKPAYASFRLTLGTDKSATLTEIDNSTFIGKWALSGEKTLVLSSLTPVPSRTTGTIEYTISTFTNSQLVLTKLTPNPKTGNSNNEYTLEKVK